MSKVQMRVSLGSMTTSLALIMSMEAKKRLSQSINQVLPGILVTLVLW